MPSRKAQDKSSLSENSSTRAAKSTTAPSGQAARRRPGRDPLDSDKKSEEYNEDGSLASSGESRAGVGSSQARVADQNKVGRSQPSAEEVHSNIKDSAIFERHDSQGANVHSNGEIKAEQASESEPASGARSSGYEWTFDAQADHAREAEDRIRLQFPGDEMVRKLFPKALDLGEEALNIWVKEDFDRIQVPNPLLRLAVKAGLKQAKKMEKKVLESPVTEKVVTQVFTAGLKVQNTIEELKQKVRKKL